jgi:hypothetical protein
MTTSSLTYLNRAADEQLGDRPARLPAWLDPSQLPPIHVGEDAFTPRQIHAVLNALRDSTRERPAPLLLLLKQHAVADSLDAFARALCGLWMEAGLPTPHRWALDALGHLGGDAGAVSLAAMIRNWMAQNQTRRATDALGLLRLMGGETALLELAKFARTGKRGRVQQVAAGLLMAVAQERGLTTAQLDDRTVPDLGLDADGGRSLDYGPRQFRLVVDGNLKPRLRDGKGVLKSSLPPANRADDPAKVEKAKEEWKLLSKQLRAILTTQQDRLEQSMLSGRRWSAAEFDRYLVRHPVVGLLARRLLWSTEGQTFRVTEDRTLADRDESPVSLEPMSSVRLVHPLHLDETTRHAWQETLTDHEIIAPFPQLARRVRTLTLDERQAHVITRQQGVAIPCITLVGILDRLGWDRGPRLGSPSIDVRAIAPRHLKYYPSADILAFLDHSPGVPAIGFFLYADDQTLGVCGFVRGISGEVGAAHAIPLVEVDPVILSEVLGLMEVLREKGSVPSKA